MDEDTFIGVQAREDLAKDLEEQVQESVKMGAKTPYRRGSKKGILRTYYFNKVTRDMPVFKEETFGPAIGITSFKTDRKQWSLSMPLNLDWEFRLFTKD